MKAQNFELRPFRGKEVYGRKGFVDGFGDVVVAAKRRKSSVRSGSKQLEVSVSGDCIPRVTYRTMGPGRPSLKNARLAIEDIPVRLTFNSKGLRSTSRSLHFEFRDRHYEYVAAEFDKGGILRRTGVVISLTRGKASEGKGMSSFGLVDGEADPVDIALAALFEEVDTLEITTSGAASGLLNKILYPDKNETPTD